MAWLRQVRLQLLSQLQYLIVDCARRRIGVISPHLVQQFLATQDALGVFDEILQQFELVCRQCNRLAGTLAISSRGLNGLVT